MTPKTSDKFTVTKDCDLGSLFIPQNTKINIHCWESTTSDFVFTLNDSNYTYIINKSVFIEGINKGHFKKIEDIDYYNLPIGTKIVDLTGMYPTLTIINNKRNVQIPGEYDCKYPNGQISCHSADAIKRTVDYKQARIELPTEQYKKEIKEEWIEPCKHEYTYLNIISPSLQFRVCKKCRKEVK